jgi:hypothetical protein
MRRCAQDRETVRAAGSGFSGGLEGVAERMDSHWNGTRLRAILAAAGGIGTALGFALFVSAQRAQEPAWAGKRRAAA